MTYLQHLSVSKSTPEISGPCIFCQQEYTIPFASFDLMNDCLTAYVIHEHKMQDAFPQLSDDQREFMISGVCPTCWDTCVKRIDVPDFEDDKEIRLLEDTVQEIDEIEEVDDFADIDDFEEDDFFLPTEFPPNED